MTADLLGPKFVRELQALRRHLAVRARSGSLGERSALRRGGSAEFETHRPYTPGDDLRRLDWLAFARTGEPLTRLHRAEESAVVRLLLDASASLGHGEPSKLLMARQVAAAMGYLALADSQCVQVLVAQPRPLKPALRSPGVGSWCARRRGRGSLAAMLQDLSVQANGTVDLSRTIDAAIRQTARPGMLVVLSDFFDAGPVTRALGRARSAGHEVALLQVLERGEINPSWEGDCCLVDSETEATLEVTMDAAAVAAYRRRFTRLIEDLRGWAQASGSTYVRTITSESPLYAVFRLVARSVD